MTFMGLDAFNAGAHILICNECGKVFWFYNLILYNQQINLPDCTADCGESEKWLVNIDYVITLT